MNTHKRMNHCLNTSSLLFCKLFLLFTPEINLLSENCFGSHDEFKICGSFRNKKLSDALFQDIRSLSLYCDSTFSYRHTNCIHPETSYGTWTLNKNLIILSVTRKVKRLADKEKKTKRGYKYLNLDGTILTLNDSTIIWKRSDKWTDTLYRQYTDLSVK